MIILLCHCTVIAWTLGLSFICWCPLGQMGLRCKLDWPWAALKHHVLPTHHLSSVSAQPWAQMWTWYGKYIFSTNSGQIAGVQHRTTLPIDFISSNIVTPKETEQNCFDCWYNIIFRDVITHDNYRLSMGIMTTQYFKSIYKTYVLCGHVGINAKWSHFSSLCSFR